MEILQKTLVTRMSTAAFYVFLNDQEGEKLAPKNLLDKELCLS